MGSKTAAARFAFDSDENYTPEQLRGLKARHPNETVIVGGNPLNPGWAETEATAKDLGLPLHRYEMGPGQPRSQNGNAGDNNIRRRRARALGVTEREYRNGVWLTDLTGRLADAKARGHEPYSLEIDDLEVVTKGKGSKTVEVYRQYQDWAKANGVATRLVPKNLNIEQWQAVADAVQRGHAAGGLDRSLIADVAVSEEFLGQGEHAEAGQKPKGAAIAKGLGITQVDTTDTHAYKSPPEGFLLPNTKLIGQPMKLGGPKPVEAMSNAELHELSVASSKRNLATTGSYADDMAVHNEIAQRIWDGRISKDERAAHQRDWAKRVMPSSVDKDGNWLPGAAEKAVQREQDVHEGKFSAPMKLGGPKESETMSKAKAREAAARANLEAQGIKEGTDAYYEAMERAQAGRVPKRESSIAANPTSADAFGTWDRMTNQMENGVMHPKVERMYGPAQDAMRHSIEQRGGAMKRAEEAGFMKLGGPKMVDQMSNEELHQANVERLRRGESDDNPVTKEFGRRTREGRIAPSDVARMTNDLARAMPKSEIDKVNAQADADDGEIEERTIATDAVDNYGDSDMLGPGLHPRVKGQLDKAMDVMQRSQMARGVRGSHVVFPGEPPIFEGGFSESHQMRGFAEASSAFQSGQPRAAAAQPETGEGNWTGVREGGRGFANPAVQRAAQAARKGK